MHHLGTVEHASLVSHVNVPNMHVRQTNVVFNRECPKRRLLTLNWTNYLPLGDKRFLMVDEPGLVDCSIFGALAQTRWQMEGSP